MPDEIPVVQRVTKFSDDVAVIRGRDGLFLINRHDIYVGKALETYGEYGQIEGDLLKRLVAHGDIVIEVGANIGSHTVGLAKAVGPKGRVIALEAQRICFAFLQAQIALNGFTNIAALHAGAGATPGIMHYELPNYKAEGNFGGVSLNASENGEAVRIVTLDDQMLSLKPALIKIDVEGMELAVITGARKLIERSHPMLYVENDRAEKSRDLIALIVSLGYRAWWHLPPLFNPDNFFGESQNIYGKTVSANMLCSFEKLDLADGLIEITSTDQPHPIFG